jgi:hypothetical protein
VDVLDENGMKIEAVSPIGLRGIVVLRKPLREPNKEIPKA